MSKRHRRPYPNATKTPFPDQVAADLALARIRDDRKRGPLSDREPVRSYQCECGKWHLTSRPQWREAPRLA